MLPAKWCIKNSQEARDALVEYFKDKLSEDEMEKLISNYIDYSTWTAFNYPNFRDGRGFRAGNHTGTEPGYDEITADELLATLSPVVKNNYSLF